MIITDTAPGCIFSACEKYRYTLWRIWDDLRFKAEPSRSYLMVIGLNPSTADDTQDDPTIRRCIDFGKRWGFAALLMTNLFAFRATDPADMKKEQHPVGFENDVWLQRGAEHAGLILAAWGVHGKHMDRAKHVVSTLRDLRCLGRTSAGGMPRHPLYVRAVTPHSAFP